VSPLLLRLAARNVRRNWRHSLGSLLAVSVGFVALSVFGGYLSHLQREVLDGMAERFMLGSLLVEGAGASQGMATSQLDTVEMGEPEQAFVDQFLAAEGAEVEARARFLLVWGRASTGRAAALFTGWGYDVAGGAGLRGRHAWDAIAGKPLQLAGPEAAQLGKGLGALLDCLPGPGPAAGAPPPPQGPERPLACRRARVQLVATTADGRVNAVEPTVVGLVDAGRRELDARHLAMPLEQAQRLRDTRNVTFYSVRLRDPARAAALSRKLEAAARDRGLALEALPWLEHALGAQAKRGMQLLDAFRGLMALVVVTIAGMAVFTTMVRSVAERTGEIGTLRSLGMLRRQVVALFALEAGLLSGLACAGGLALTLALSVATNRAGLTYQAGLMSEPIPLGIALDPSAWVRAAAFLTAVAVLAALLPARRAVRLRIPDALGHA